MTNDLLETLIQIIYREAGSKIKKALNTIDEVKRNTRNSKSSIYLPNNGLKRISY